MLLRLIALIALAALSGCGVLYKLDVQQGNLFNKTQVETLKPGMSKRQVLLVMGSPSIISPFNQNRWDYVSSIKRGRGKMESKDLVLYFENEALARIEGDYFPEDPEQLIRDARKYKRQYPDEKREDDKKKRRGGEGQG
ncbi:outer membrane protein assembly factor BamE [Dokdonella immobilis]|uniref:Outer membrane protein assembly factor BamE n=1 Tax=Dokdonella immobilis TaxID=578942 RepID=A0A1I4VZR4_9GAMM|nr:outer membrane protein assembly factor BamE [Dokdonella immobilis]SFN06804.1 Beta-barrel assembly machine subunit BamE [Dokdonella immobilis]